MHSLIRETYVASEQPGYRDPVSFGFALADVLLAHGHDIPPGVNYSPSPLGLTDREEWTFEAVELEALLSQGQIEPSDLQRALQVVSRFIRILDTLE